MRTFRHLVRAIVVSLAIFSLSVSLTSNAFAGTNGQQVKVRYHFCNHRYGGSEGIERITVSGKNQDGSDATWSKTINRHRGCTSRGIAENVTHGWWWKGPVTITLEYRGGEVTRSGPRTWTATYTCHATVPTRYHHSTYTIGCND
jgi:hypothetical protein